MTGWCSPAALTPCFASGGRPLPAPSLRDFGCMLALTSCAALIHSQVASAPLGGKRGEAQRSDAKAALGLVPARLLCRRPHVPPTDWSGSMRSTRSQRERTRRREKGLEDQSARDAPSVGCVERARLRWQVGGTKPDSCLQGRTEDVT